LLQGKHGNRQNVEVTLQVETSEEAEKLQQAFIVAGGIGSAPSEEYMYVPIRSCWVRDLFGTGI
jgi:hypothetical protein